MRRWVRHLLTFAVALAAWAVAMPVRAATRSEVVVESGPSSSFSPAPPPQAPPMMPTARAPLCDDRAATMFAPAPQLQAPETSIDIGDGADSCLTDFLDDGVAHQGDGSRPSPTAPDAAMTIVIPVVASAPHVAVGVPLAASFALPLGVQSRVDRPPRG